MRLANQTASAYLKPGTGTVEVGASQRGIEKS
jgi:hypothetical protein